MTLHLGLPVSSLHALVNSANEVSNAAKNMTRNSVRISTAWSSLLIDRQVMCETVCYHGGGSEQLHTSMPLPRQAYVIWSSTHIVGCGLFMISGWTRFIHSILMIEEAQNSINFSWAPVSKFFRSSGILIIVFN
ncbi:uncharacterized protein N7477_001279 [Penicillium maclennaniae]|uniref:uncharacterized protein n=1 Tax=Penicillium maclennaniae TaxID=1343394 RepID=UPI002541FA1E|nr:uncharacterized protein N7477_001279 [Penicillium maclennaniae]KAJ5681339.1 hypothetical protein N7477_001279 [Penicillium maclennaniae]